MKRWGEFIEPIVKALMGGIDTLRRFKTSAHDECIGGVICELLVLDDISTAIEYGSRHCMNDAWLICTLQGSDEIHVPSLKATSA
jgi:hypothetical protein